MCGIAGVWGLADRAIASQMIEAMEHRGPDGRGLYPDDLSRVVLGHCRLAIIDLSPLGHQPMSYANGRYWITYNGEVYNFAEVKAGLEGKGYRFVSNSDTEVILAAYDAYGPSCLDRFRGMFAFAIWDRDERRLFLARDRFGIKPLYWAMINGVFLFASELKGMLASGLVSRRLNPDAIWHYLSLGAVSAPRTVLADVSALLPGHYMIVEKGQVAIHQYWDLQRSPNSFQKGIHPVEAERELRRLLEESIRLHMIADVPVGAFLSGGIDSTAVVGMMSHQLDKPLRTFSIGFKGVGEKLSELHYAKIAAKHYGTDHHEVLVSGEDVAREFDQFIDAIDQPSGDGVNTYLVSKATKEGVTVALSGLGGDEMFAGYLQFYRLQLAERLGVDGNPLARAGLAMMKRVGPGRWRHLAEFLAAGSFAQRYATIRLLYGEDEKQALVSQEMRSLCKLERLTDFYAAYIHPELDVVARTSYLEAKTYMANTLLRDTDATSMSYALEIRVPLLDHVLAQFAFNLAPGLKLQGRKTKVVFIQAIQDLLPKEIARRGKMGFELPMREWLAGPLHDIVNEKLASKEAAQIFSSHGLEKMLHMAQNGVRPYLKVWAPVVLIAWMQRHRCHL